MIAVLGFQGSIKTHELAEERGIPIIFIESLVTGFDLFVEFFDVGFPVIVNV